MTTDEMVRDSSQWMALRAYLRAVIFAEPLQMSLLAHYGIRLPELQALRRLSDLGSVPISQFADALGISRSTATGLVDRLEGRGLVTRMAGTIDRRMIHVTVTPRAQIALEDRALLQDSVLAQRITALSAEEQRQLTELLTRITEVDLAERIPASDTPMYHDTNRTRG